MVLDRSRVVACTFSLGVLLVGLSALNGCGKSTPAPAEGTRAGELSTTVAAVKPEAPSGVDAALPVVRQFLDAMRRGGADSQAQALLTSEAQRVTTSNGLILQPIGAPDATYEVTRAEPYPGEPNACLVHSRWQEPDGQGGTAHYEVVWMLQKEAENWRISGMVLETDPNSDPISIDFEDAKDVLAKLSGENPDGDAPPKQEGSAAGDAAMQTASAPSNRQ
jgi:hypothetical protein